MGGNSRHVERPLSYGCQKRFFTALDALIDVGVIPHLAAFCKEANLNRGKYSFLRLKYRENREREVELGKYYFIDVAALVLLCTKYGVSGEWLLADRGKMLRDKQCG